MITLGLFKESYRRIKRQEDQRVKQTSVRRYSEGKHIDAIHDGYCQPWID